MLIRQRRLAIFVHLDDLDPERGNAPVHLPTPDDDPEAHWASGKC